MTASPAPHRRVVNTIVFVALLAAILVIVAFSAFGTKEWVIPAAAKTWKNPVTPTEAELGRARELYRNKCASCHGASGAGDGSDAPLWGPRPTDFTDSARMDAQSDGELFYKISEGKRPMPGFRKRLTDYQRWQLVLFLRSLSAGQHAAPTASDGSKAPAPAEN